MKCEIITIGDELLIGQVVDTNSAWMAEKLNENGIELYQITSVHDQSEHIRMAVDEALKRVDVVLTTGGLGPTKDDITKTVLCDYFETALVYNPAVEAHVRELYKDRPAVLNRLTETQWMVPESATILPNRVGSAPIMLFEKTMNGEAKTLISMPGVPREMETAMTEQVLPWLHNHHEAQMQHIEHHTLLVRGIAESSLAIRLEDWERNLPPSLHLAYLPKNGAIRLRLSSYDEVGCTQMESAWETLKHLVAEWLVEEQDTYEGK